MTRLTNFSGSPPGPRQAPIICQAVALFLSPLLALAASAQGTISAPLAPAVPRADTSNTTILPTDVVPLAGGQERTNFGENFQMRLMQRLPSRFYFSGSFEMTDRYETNPFQFPKKRQLIRQLPPPPIVRQLDFIQQSRLNNIIGLAANDDTVFRLLPNASAGWTVTPRTRIFGNYFMIRDQLSHEIRLNTIIHSLGGGLQQDFPVTSRGNLQLELQGRNLWQLHQQSVFDFLPGLTFSYILNARTVLFANSLIQARGKSVFVAPIKEIDPFFTWGLLHQRNGWTFSASSTFVQNFRHQFRAQATIPTNNYVFILDFEIARRVMKQIPGLQAFVRIEPIYNFHSNNTPGLSGMDFRAFAGMRFAVAKPALTATMTQIRQQLEETETVPSKEKQKQDPGKGPKPSAFQFLQPNEVTAHNPQPIHGFLARGGDQETAFNPDGEQPVLLADVDTAQVIDSLRSSETDETSVRDVTIDANSNEIENSTNTIDQETGTTTTSKSTLQITRNIAEGEATASQLDIDDSSMSGSIAEASDKYVAEEPGASSVPQAASDSISEPPVLSNADPMASSTARSNESTSRTVAPVAQAPAEVVPAASASDVPSKPLLFAWPVRSITADHIALDAPGGHLSPTDLSRSVSESRINLRGIDKASALNVNREWSSTLPTLRQMNWSAVNTNQLHASINDEVNELNSMEIGRELSLALARPPVPRPVAQTARKISPVATPNRIAPEGVRKTFSTLIPTPALGQHPIALPDAPVIHSGGDALLFTIAPKTLNAATSFPALAHSPRVTRAPDSLPSPNLNGRDEILPPQLAASIKPAARPEIAAAYQPELMRTVARKSVPILPVPLGGLSAVPSQAPSPSTAGFTPLEIIATVKPSKERTLLATAHSGVKLAERSTVVPSAEAPQSVRQKTAHQLIQQSIPVTDAVPVWLPPSRSLAACEGNTGNAQLFLSSLGDDINSPKETLAYLSNTFRAVIDDPATQEANSSDSLTSSPVLWVAQSDLENETSPTVPAETREKKLAAHKLSGKKRSKTTMKLIPPLPAVNPNNKSNPLQDSGISIKPPVVRSR